MAGLVWMVNQIKDAISELKSDRAYDNSSDTFKTIIQNSVEVEQPDAFQMSEVLIDGEVLSADSSIYTRIPPRGAKGFIATVILSDTVTDETGGYKLIVGAKPGGTKNTTMRITTDEIKSSFERHAVTWYPGASTGDLETTGSYKQSVVPMPLPREMVFQVSGAMGKKIILEVAWLV